MDIDIRATSLLTDYLTGQPRRVGELAA